jgi:hypothetical protein
LKHAVAQQIAVSFAPCWHVLFPGSADRFFVESRGFGGSGTTLLESFESVLPQAFHRPTMGLLTSCQLGEGLGRIQRRRVWTGGAEGALRRDKQQGEMRRPVPYVNHQG